MIFCLLGPNGPTNLLASSGKTYSFCYYCLNLFLRVKTGFLGIRLKNFPQLPLGVKSRVIPDFRKFCQKAKTL